MIRVNFASGMLVEVNVVVKEGRTLTDTPDNQLATSPAPALHMIGPTVPVADFAAGRIRRDGFIRHPQEHTHILGLPVSGRR